MPWQNKICHCKAPVLSVGGVTSGRDTDGITSNMTEEDVVRELGCDNQEIKISLKKNKTTLLLLLHSPSTLFSFLLYVSSSSGGGGGGKSYLHLKWTEGTENVKKNGLKRFSAQRKCHFHKNSDHSQQQNTQKKNKTKRGGLKSNCCAGCRCSWSPGAAGNWGTL